MILFVVPLIFAFAFLVEWRTRKLTESQKKKDV